MMKMSVRLLGSSGSGPLVLIRMVRASTALALSTVARRDFMSDPSARARSIEKTTSSAVKAAPSWNVTFGRSLNSHTVGSDVRVQTVASAGTIQPSSWRTMSGS
jgi:hypothetical protein